MKACIVVLSYNHPELTARALRSAMQFSDCKPILVHNGSAPFHVGNLKKQFPEITHVELFPNRGYSGGVNAGLQFAFDQGFEWAFLLTNDCVLEKLKVPSRSPSLLAPLLFRRNRDRIDSLGGCFDPLLGRIWHIKEKSEFEKLTSQERHFPLRYFPYVPGSAFWIHRQVFFGVGSLDESLGTYWEDVDYSVRSFQSGFQLGLDSETQVIHAVGKTNHKDPLYTTYFYQRNRRIVSNRYVSPAPLPRMRLNLNLTGSFVKHGIRLAMKKDVKRLRLLRLAVWDSFLKRSTNKKTASS